MNSLLAKIIKLTVVMLLVSTTIMRVIDLDANTRQYPDNKIHKHNSDELGSPKKLGFWEKFDKRLQERIEKAKENERKLFVTILWKTFYKDFFSFGFSAKNCPLQL